MKRILLLSTMVLLVSCGGGGGDGSPYTPLNPDKEEDAKIIEAVETKSSDVFYSLAKKQGSYRYDVTEESKIVTDDPSTPETSRVTMHHEYAFDGDTGFYAYETWADESFENRTICYGKKENGILHYTKFAYEAIDGAPGQWHYGEERDTTSDIDRQFFALGEYSSYLSYSCTLSNLYNVEYKADFSKNDKHIKVVIKGEYLDFAGYSKMVVDYTYIATLDGLPVSIDSKVAEYESEDKATFKLDEEWSVKAKFEYGANIERKNADTIGYSGEMRTN